MSGAEEVVLPGCPEIVWDGPFPLRCGKGGTGGICSTHGRFSDPTPEPWRFDVPATIPAHVTALKDAGETVWLRLPDGTWTANRYMRSAGALFVHVVQYAHLPLVEHPDPRKDGQP